MFNSSEEAMQYIGKQSIEMVDLKFVDLPGRWHHITIPASSVNELLFYKGIPFDSSSVPGFRGVSCGDMSLIPDVATGFIDPFTELATLSFICNICEADTRANISGDPRGVAIRAVKYLRDKLSAESLWLPELEFYLFDGVAYETGNEFAYFEFDSAEIDSAESGYYNHSNGGYHALPPADRYYDIRSEMVHNAEAMGVPIRYHHHEAGARGQQEIEIVPAPLLDGADAVMLVKYAVKMTAVRYGLVATFLPKPLYNESGNGMHFHQFLVKDDKSLFWDDSAEYAHLSDSALAYIAGILDHALRLYLSLFLQITTRSRLARRSLLA